MNKMALLRIEFAFGTLFIVLELKSRLFYSSVPLFFSNFVFYLLFLVLFVLCCSFAVLSLCQSNAKTTEFVCCTKLYTALKIIHKIFRIRENTAHPAPNKSQRNKKHLLHIQTQMLTHFWWWKTTKDAFVARANKQNEWKCSRTTHNRKKNGKKLVRMENMYKDIQFSNV